MHNLMHKNTDEGVFRGMGIKSWLISHIFVAIIVNRGIDVSKRIIY